MGDRSMIRATCGGVTINQGVVIMDVWELVFKGAQVASIVLTFNTALAGEIINQNVDPQAVIREQHDKAYREQEEKRRMESDRLKAEDKAEFAKLQADARARDEKLKREMIEQQAMNDAALQKMTNEQAFREQAIKAENELFDKQMKIGRETEIQEQNAARLRAAIAKPVEIKTGTVMCIYGASPKRVKVEVIGKADKTGAQKVTVIQRVNGQIETDSYWVRFQAQPEITGMPVGGYNAKFVKDTSGKDVNGSEQVMFQCE